MVACWLTTASPRLTSPCSAGTLPSHTTGGSMERFQSMQISRKETLGRFFPASPLSTLSPKRRVEESAMILITSRLNARRPQRPRKSTCWSTAEGRQQLKCAQRTATSKSLRKILKVGLGGTRNQDQRPKIQNF